MGKTLIRKLVAYSLMFLLAAGDTFENDLHVKLINKLRRWVNNG